MARSSKAPASDRSVDTTDNYDPSLDGEPATNGQPLDKTAAQRLKAFVERIERIEGEIKGQRDDIKEIKAEAKGSGFDVGVINFILKIRKQDADDREEFETQVEVYQRALGMIP